MMHSCFVRFQGALMFFSWWFNVQISCIPTEFIHFKSSGSFSLLITGEVISATKTTIFCSDYLKQWIQRESSEIMFAIVMRKVVFIPENNCIAWVPWLSLREHEPASNLQVHTILYFFGKKMLLFHYLVWLTLQDSTRGTSEYISTLFGDGLILYMIWSWICWQSKYLNLNVFVLQFEWKYQYSIIFNFMPPWSMSATVNAYFSLKLFIVWN
jgi:hypothetical protein